MGWSLGDPKGDVVYKDGVKTKNIVPSGKAVLYAQWGYTVKYFANNENATTNMPDSIMFKGHDNILCQPLFNQTKGRFIGWNTAQDGSGTMYQPGESVDFKPDSNGIVTLYAQWFQLCWPVPEHNNIIQPYHGIDEKYGYEHYAIDICDDYINGAPVVAAEGGTVKLVFKCTKSHYPYENDCHGFGTGIVVEGDDGRTYQYAHMQAGSIPATIYLGARVEQGQEIGNVGMTGMASGPHLHFGISTSENYYQDLINPADEFYRD